MTRCAVVCNTTHWSSTHLTLSLSTPKSSQCQHQGQVLLALAFEACCPSIASVYSSNMPADKWPGGPFLHAGFWGNLCALLRCICAPVCRHLHKQHQHNTLSRLAPTDACTLALTHPCMSTRTRSTTPSHVDTRTHATTMCQHKAPRRCTMLAKTRHTRSGLGTCWCQLSAKQTAFAA